MVLSVNSSRYQLKNRQNISFQANRTNITLSSENERLEISSLSNELSGRSIFMSRITIRIFIYFVIVPLINHKYEKKNLDKEHGVAINTLSLISSLTNAM